MDDLNNHVIALIRKIVAYIDTCIRQMMNKNVLFKNQRNYGCMHHLLVVLCRLTEYLYTVIYVCSVCFVIAICNWFET